MLTIHYYSHRRQYFLYDILADHAETNDLSAQVSAPFVRCILPPLLLVLPSSSRANVHRRFRQLPDVKNRMINSLTVWVASVHKSEGPTETNCLAPQPTPAPPPPGPAPPVAPGPFTPTPGLQNCTWVQDVTMPGSMPVKQPAKSKVRRDLAGGMCTARANAAHAVIARSRNLISSHTGILLQFVL
jgi:hypothetical protein